MKKILVIGLGIFLLNSSLSSAEEPYTLWNPKPSSEMEDMETDRPDTTESPIAVEPGHLQLELSFLDYTKNYGSNGGEEYSWVPMNIKLGLIQDLDVQFVIDPYTENHNKNEHDQCGFGNSQIRIKKSFSKSADENIAAAVMPYFELPTGHGDLNSEYVPVGLIVPVSFSVSERSSFTIMGQLDYVRNREQDSYGTDFLHTVSYGRDLIDELGAYVEYIGIAHDRSSEDYVCYFSYGFTYSLTKNLQLDLGMRSGINSYADDLNLFSGISVRV